MKHFIHYLLTPSAWSWPDALIIGIVTLWIGIYALLLFAARIESWHQRRVRQREEAWAALGRRISISIIDHKRGRRRYG